MVHDLLNMSQNMSVEHHVKNMLEHEWKMTVLISFSIKLRPLCGWRIDISQAAFITSSISTFTPAPSAAPPLLAQHYVQSNLKGGTDICMVPV